MSWDDFKRRRAAIAAVLAYADANPDADLAYTCLPEVSAEFGSRRELILALQYDWSLALWGQIETLSIESDNEPVMDSAKLVKAAWAAATKSHQTLRRLLDKHLNEAGELLHVALSRQSGLMVSAEIGQSAQGPRYVTCQVA